MTKRTLSILIAVSVLAFGMQACSQAGDSADNASNETVTEEVMENSSNEMDTENSSEMDTENSSEMDNENSSEMENENSSETDNENSSEMENENSSEMEQNESSPEADFPVPPSTKVMQSNSELLVGTTTISMDDVISFYREESTGRGLKEDTLLTSITDSTFSLVFRGSTNGKMLVVQGTTFEDDNVAFSVRYE